MTAEWYLSSVANLFKFLLQCLKSTHFCSWRSFDNVTRIHFRFRPLVTRSSVWPWCIFLPNFVEISLSNAETSTFFEMQYRGRRYDVTVLCHWSVSSIPNLVQMSFNLLRSTYFCSRRSADEVTHSLTVALDQLAISTTILACDLSKTKITRSLLRRRHAD